MTAPDPGLTDLLAAHWTTHEVDEDGDWLACDCGERLATPRLWAAHLNLVVEQHTNGRIAELEATRRRTYDAAMSSARRVLTLEATVARVQTLAEDDEYTSLPGFRAELRAALEGEQR